MQLSEMNSAYHNFDISDMTNIFDSGKKDRTVSRELHKQMVIEEELKQALQGVKPMETPKKTSYPIASAVGKKIIPIYFVGTK
jgi:hypothetical protein